MLSHGRNPLMDDWLEVRQGTVGRLLHLADERRNEPEQARPMSRFDYLDTRDSLADGTYGLRKSGKRNKTVPALTISTAN